jgi:hypothetical protein
MKSKIVLLIILFIIFIGAGLAGAVDIKTSPMKQNIPAMPDKDKEYFNIGQKDPQKEKPSGVWVDFFLEKNTAVGCGLSVNAPTSNSQNGNRGILGFGATQIEGCVGFKFMFK